MSKATKIERPQRAFLKAMKEKFAADPAATSQPRLLNPAPEQYVVINCPICRGRGYRGPPDKRSFCHNCGSTGKKRVRA